MNILRFINDSGYQLKKFIPDKLNKLGFFLEESQPDASIWINFIKNKNDVFLCGELIELEKREEKIYISNALLDNFEVDENPFVISSKELIRILKEWETLCKSKVSEIILTQNGEHITLVGKK